MEEKIDYKKNYKSLYLPTTAPVIIEVPRMKFAMISGTGNPNGGEFAQAVEALYSISYSVKMSYKSDDIPYGYYEYTVFPLEGVWDINDKSKPIGDKDNYKYIIMIRQPEFLTDELFEKFLVQVKKKKPNKSLDKMVYGEIEEGLCCQAMHMGSYDNEPESFARMENLCNEKGYIRASKTHREIYLSDPRKTEVSRLKTVLRFSVGT